MINPETVELIAKETLGWPEKRKWNSKDKDRRFRSCFGASSRVVAELWNCITQQEVEEPGSELKHLLWALIFLKVYATMEIHCSIVGWPCAKSFAKWSWYFVEKLANLKDKFISLENRFDGLGAVVHTNCFISVDGTDCPVFEPWPFTKKMYSHKLNGPGLKYEVAVCLKTGRIVWINGPFDGSKNDSTIFKEGLSNHLYDEEAVEADAGYNGDFKLKAPGMGKDSKERKMKSNARAQHEAVNGRLKQFNVLTTHFRHLKPRNAMKKKHQLCFNAVAVITQVKFINGEHVFEDQLDYDCHYF